MICLSEKKGKITQKEHLKDVKISHIKRLEGGAANKNNSFINPLKETEEYSTKLPFFN